MRIPPTAICNWPGPTQTMRRVMVWLGVPDGIAPCRNSDSNLCLFESNCFRLTAQSAYLILQLSLTLERKYY
jgi:hypothetical protein